jgi:hypothetical protein
MANRADEFPARIRAEIAAAAGHRCSMPDCRAPTSGPSESQASGEAKAGIAAHIAAASPGGPRYDPTQTPQERRGRDNATGSATPTRGELTPTKTVSVESFCLPGGAPQKIARAQSSVDPMPSPY